MDPALIPKLEVPPDCGHPDWVVGCERCFFEVKSLALGNLSTANGEAQMEGAILMNWHVLMVVADMEMQIAPLAKSLELDKVRLAKELIANLKALRVHLLGLGASPEKMTVALQQAARIAAQVKQLQQEMDTKEAAQESLITLTDRGAA